MNALILAFGFGEFEMRTSDIIYLSLNFLLIYWIWRSYQHPYNQKIWIKLFRQSVPSVALGILSLFWLISILDSIVINHLSLLDKLFYPLNHFMEYSYSRPFDRYLLLPKVRFIDGRYQSLYSHLKYVPVSFKTTASIIHFVLQQILLVFSVMGFFILMLWFLLRKKWHQWANYQKNMLWSGLSMLFMLSLLFCIYRCSRYFHVFGTGQIGQDIFYQSIKSIRTGMLISLMTTMLMLPFALGLGLLAGYYGKTCDLVIQFIYTTISSIPSVLFIGASLLGWQIYISSHHSSWSMDTIADTRLLMICVLLGLTDWAHLCRFIRAEVLKLRELDYIQSAKLLGSNSTVILFKHLLPNTMHLVITSLVLNFSYLVLAESVLTYLGIGVSPLTISWGNMINAARLELARDPVIWWPLWSAFIFMFLLVLSCNLFADGLRRALNPREEIH